MNNKKVAGFNKTSSEKNKKKESKSYGSGLSFLKHVIKETSNPYASICSDGTVYDSTGYIDLGNYLLNKQSGGDMFKGAPSNTCSCFAGHEGVGKTYVILGIIKSFLDANPEGVVTLFESEGAIKQHTLMDREIDINRVALHPISTIEEFRFECNKAIDSYGEIDSKERFPYLIALDSLGMLSDKKEMGDAEKGEDKADMGGHARRIKATFRVIRQKLAKNNIPLFVTNHLFADPNAFIPTHKVAGGSGLKYAADSIFILNKKKIKAGEESFEDGGIAVTCIGSKLRDTRPFTEIPFTINFTKGVTRYSGLFDFCLENGLIVKSGMQYTFLPEIDPEQIKFFKKSILDVPEKYFTLPILEKINKAMDSIFLFGSPVEQINNIRENMKDEEIDEEGEEISQ